MPFHGSHRGQAQRRKVPLYSTASRQRRLHRRGRIRHHARPYTWDCRNDGRRFEVVDTAASCAKTRSTSGQILRQAEFVLKTADHIILPVDGRAEITAAIVILAQRVSAWVCVLAVNKIARRSATLPTSSSTRHWPTSSALGRHGTAWTPCSTARDRDFCTRRWPVGRSHRRRPPRPIRHLWPPTAQRRQIDPAQRPRRRRAGPSFRRSPAPRAMPWTRP